MKKNLFAFILTITFCSAMSPSVTQSTHVQDTAMEIAITDFLKTRLSNNYNVFTVSVNERSEFGRYKISDDIITISILPLKTSFPNFIPYFDTTLGIEITPHEYYITLADTLGSTRLPTRHIIKDGKLFYWRDPEYGLTQDMIDALLNFNIAEQIDIPDSFLLLGMEGYIDDAMKGADYYFCKNNLANYKRAITSIATGSYKPPKVKCKRK